MVSAPAQGFCSIRDREHWLGLGDQLRDRATAVASALGPRVAPDPGKVRTQPLRLPTTITSFLEEVAEGDPFLEWVVMLAGTAVLLRRLGAGGKTMVMSGIPTAMAAENPAPAQPTPVLLDAYPQDSFRELLDGTRTAALSSCKHDRFPSAALRSALSTLPTVAVLHTDLHAGHVAQAAIRYERASLTLSFEHDGSVDPEVAAKLVPALLCFLNAATAAPGMPCGEHVLMSEPTRRVVLRDFNETWEVNPSPSLRELVLRWAHETPEAIAISDSVTELSYREMLARATAAARRLREDGMGIGTVVAVSCERSTDSLVASLGILLAGAAYMPLDLHAQGDRRAAMLVHADALIVAELDDAGGSVPSPTYLLDALIEPDSPSIFEEALLLGPEPEPTDLTYCIFTSGSTGTPKAATLETRALLNNLAIKREQFSLEPGVSIAQTAPVSFDVSVWQMFAPLTAGARTVVVEDQTALDMAELVELTAVHRFPVLELVPAVITALLRHLRSSSLDRDRLETSLGCLLSNGESLEPELIARWLSEVPGVPLYNAWGPAECADDVTESRIQDALAPHTSIGRPLPGHRIYVLDLDLQPLPPGLRGEIVVGGRSLGRGYLREPSKTAASFLPDPFTEVAGARMYRTGDRGRWRADGELEFMGREDFQVKLKGRRVELGEIEHALSGLSGVQSAAALVLRHQNRDRLVVFTVFEQGSRRGEERIRRELVELLPDYMAPDEVIDIAEMPLNRNGKVDRAALRLRWKQHGSTPSATVPPQSEAELVLHALWSEILDVEEIGVHDDFFALGGDSIVNLQITGRAAQRGLRLRPRDIFTHRTIADLAAVAGRDGARTGPRGTSGPLTPIQRWFFGLGLEHRDHWNQSYVLVSSQPLVPGRLARALRHVVQHHESLRTRFEGQRQLIVDPPPAETLLWHIIGDESSGFHRVEPLGQLETGTIAEHADRLHASLRLSSGELIRALLIQTPDEPDRLLVTVHHIAIDRVSWTILIEDLTTAYLALRDGSTVQLPALSTAYVDWARRLAVQTVEPEALAVSKIEPAMRPLARDERVANVLASAETAMLKLDQELTRQLLTTASSTSEMGVSAVLLAGLGRALQSELGERALTVELEGHGRQDLDDDIDIMRTVGWFTVLGPVTFAVEVERDRALVEGVAETLLAVRERSLQFHWMLAEHGAEEASGATASVADISFNYMGRIGGSTGRGEGLFSIGADLGQRYAPTSRRHVEWDVNAGVVEDELQLQLEYVPGRHDRGLVERVLAALRAFLIRFAGSSSPEDPAAGLERTCPLTPTQQSFLGRRGQLARQWNNAVLLSLASPLSTDRLDAALTTVTARHPALRTRLVRTAGGYLQGPSEDASADLPVEEVDLASDTPGTIDESIARHATELHRSLDPLTGPIGRVAVFRTPRDRPDCLLLALHHLIVDPLSWGILIDELNEHLRNGAIERPPGASVFDWAERLTEYARRDPGRLHHDYWVSQPWSQAHNLADGDGERSAPTEARLEFDLDAATTRRLAEAARTAQLSLYEYVLSLLGQAVGKCDDRSIGGAEDLLVELGGHGREDIFSDLDVSTTLGWFTTAFPFLLPISREPGSAAHLERTRDRVRAVPNRGFDFEILKFLHQREEVRDSLATVPSAQLRFDFDGELHFLDGGRAEESLLIDGRTAGTGEWKDPDASRDWLVDVIVSIFDEALHVQWQYSPREIAAERVERLARAFDEKLRVAA